MVSSQDFIHPNKQLDLARHSFTMTVGGNFAVVVTGRFASIQSRLDTSLFSRGVNSFAYLA